MKNVLTTNRSMPDIIYIIITPPNFMNAEPPPPPTFDMSKVGGGGLAGCLCLCNTKCPLNTRYADTSISAGGAWLAVSASAILSVLLTQGMRIQVYLQVFSHIMWYRYAAASVAH